MDINKRTFSSDVFEEASSMYASLNIKVTCFLYDSFTESHFLVMDALEGKWINFSSSPKAYTLLCNVVAL